MLGGAPWGQRSALQGQLGGGLWGDGTAVIWGPAAPLLTL